jgi:hypothetical protein
MCVTITQIGDVETLTFRGCRSERHHCEIIEMHQLTVSISLRIPSNVANYHLEYETLAVVDTATLGGTLHNETTIDAITDGSEAGPSGNNSSQGTLKFDCSCHVDVCNEH